MRTVVAIVGVVATLVLLEPVRVAANALVLNHYRRAYPELFDGHAAALSVAACLEEGPWW